MSSLVYVVATATPVIISVSSPRSFCAQAGATGTIMLEYSNDNGVTWLTAPQGAVAGAYSLCGPTYNLSLVSGRIRCTAATAAGTLISSDLLSYGPNSNTGERRNVFNTGVSITTPNATTETRVASVRFPAGMLTANFQLECLANVVMTNGANVKTLTAYIGNTVVPGTTTAVWTAPLTSLLNGTAHIALAGANDGQAINGWGPGLAASGGWGFGATALINLTATNYMTQEMEFCLTITKATGTDSAVLNAARVDLIL